MQVFSDDRSGLPSRWCLHMTLVIKTRDTSSNFITSPTSLDNKYSLQDILSLCNSGAILDLPSLYLQLSFCTCLSTVLASRCFVKRSTGLSLPRTLAKASRLSAATCWTHKKLVSIWRVLPRPLLWMMPSAALASPHIFPSSL